LIKGSKASDSSLVYNENFSEKLWLSGWAFGQLTWAKIYFTYDVIHKKSATPNQKYFCVQPRRLVDLFEPLNSSLVQSAEELWRW